MSHPKFTFEIAPGAAADRLERSLADEEDAARLAQLLEAQTWKFASTLPWWPHYYSLRKNWADDAAFAWCVEAIERLGVSRPFGKSAKARRFTYFDTPCALCQQGWQYWCGGPPAEATLINRARLRPAKR